MGQNRAIGIGLIAVVLLMLAVVMMPMASAATVNYRFGVYGDGGWLSGAKVQVGFNSGITNEYGYVDLPVSSFAHQTAIATKEGYVCNPTYCTRCSDNNRKCERDFVYIAGTSMTLGLKSISPTPTPTPPQICTPYEIECFGNRELWQCKSDGSDFQFMMSCPYGCEVGSTQCNPTPTLTPTPTPTVSPTATPTPTPTPDPGMCTPNEKMCFGDYLKTCNQAGDGWDETKTEMCTWGCDAEKKECPGFEMVFAILGLLTVAYFVQRKRKEE